MKHFLTFALLALLVTSCNNELQFEEKSYSKKSSVPCSADCPHVDIKIPVAKNVPIVADSINKKIFAVMKEIVFVGEKPFPSTDYNGLTSAFIQSYEEIQKKEPSEKIGWEAEITGRITYQSDNILNIGLKSYAFTGGAHGYGGERSLIFDPETGKNIPNDKLFKDVPAFEAFAEKKFRKTYNISEGKPLNESGFMFEDEKFTLPQTFFFTDKGFLLYYNVYEIASYADGAKQVLIPYSEMEPYLAVK
ncbi:DUF3298 domain-containing protein [Flavobacterium sp. 3HN19-14]|uniref:DUF3298 and DUF4163 domain-containing protein n=1 Tax=Flavobacterium sp. 3HN19-14 TaxID=3448133 RepID=UPI003EDF3D63